MRFYITVLAGIVILTVGFVNLIHRENPEELVPAPIIRSVLFEDGRSYCDKLSELSMIEDWEERCKLLGDDNRCSLPVKSAREVSQQQGFFHERCEWALR